MAVIDVSISIHGTVNPNHQQLSLHKVKVLYSSFTRAPISLKEVDNVNITDIRFIQSEIKISQNHHSAVPSTLSINACTFGQKDIHIENMREVSIRNCDFKHLKMKIVGYDLETVNDKLEEHEQFKIAAAKYVLDYNTFYEVKLKGKMVGEFSMDSCRAICSYFTIEGIALSTNTTQFMSSLSLKNSHFGTQVNRGNCKVNQDDSLVTFQKALTKVSKSSFSMTQIIPEGFLKWKSNYLKSDLSQLIIVDTHFYASGIKVPVTIIATPPSAKAFEIRNVSIECSYILRSFQFDVRSIIFCDIHCNPGEYKVINSKEHTVALVQKPSAFVGLSIIQPQTPGCPTCPVGGICKQNVIAAAPGYWGYIDESKDSVHIVRCPHDYCCSSREHCVDILSCNTGRTGTLCGSCKSNLTEPLFSTICVPADNCHTSLIAFVFTLAVLGYALFLLSFDTIKDFLKEKMKKCFNCGKQDFRKTYLKWLMRDQPETNEPLPVTIHLSPLLNSLLLPNSSSLKGSEVGNYKKLSGTKDKKLGTFVELGQSCNVEEIQSTLVSSMILANYENALKSLPKARYYSMTNLKDNYIEEKTLKKPSFMILYPESQKLNENSKYNESTMKYLQIIMYFVQDCSLLKVHLPDLAPVTENYIMKFLQFSPDILSVYVGFTEMCFVPNTTPILKVVFQAALGPGIMILLLIIYSAQHLLSKFICKSWSFWNRIKSKICEAFLLSVLLCYQKMVIGALTLLKCIDIAGENVLYIQGDVKCGDFWQYIIEVYLGMCIVPVFIFLSLGPHFVKEKQMSVSAFLLSCLFPLPVIVYLILKYMCTACKSHNNLSQNQISDQEGEVKGNIAKTSTDKDDKYSESEEALMETLEKHYKSVKICNLNITWLVFHKFYRFALVACNSYITEPLPRLCALTALVLSATLFLKPFKDNMANFIVRISFIASSIIAILNLTKAALLAGGYESNSLVLTVLNIFDLFESALKSWMPLGAAVIWAIFAIWTTTCKKKMKKKRPKCLPESCFP